MKRRPFTNHQNGVACHAIALLSGDEAGQAARALSRAFQEDPVNAYVLPNPEERAERFPAVYEAFLHYALLVGEVWTTGSEVRGASAWIPPTHREMRLDLMVGVGLHRLPAMIGEESASRLVNFIRHLESVHRSAVDQPHWYLMLLGVDPDVQGHGLGSSLLGPVLARCDDEAMPCYVETAQLKNLPFYRKHGFKDLSEQVEPQSGLRFWNFVREPRR